jgi:hypothetical protein
MKLSLAVHQASVSSLQAVKVSLSLDNDTAVAYRLPGPYDLTDALTLLVHRADGTLLRRMNGLTRQGMMSTGRVDPTPLLEELPAGQCWNWDLDLANYHYSLPAGDFELEAVYVDSHAGVSLRSPRVPLHVAPAALQHLVHLCDAPVLDGITLLLRSGGPGLAPTTVLRQHNAQHPLAAWYSECIPDNGVSPIAVSGVAWNGPVKPFLAAARFFTTDSFEPTFDKWIVSTDGTSLFAHRFRRGRPDRLVHMAPLPAGRSLLPSACYDEADRLLVFFQQPAGTIEAYEFASDGLRLRFAHDVPRTLIPPAIRADCDFIHVVTPWRGLLYHRLTLAGVPQERTQLFATRMHPATLDIDPAQRRARAIFRDSPRGRALALVVVGPGISRVESLAIDRLPVRGLVREMSFDQDRGGHFHLLVSTSRRRLYYLRDGMGPALMGAGEDRFFPIVHAPTSIYLGCNATETGYRFLPYRQAAYRHRVALSEESL